MKEDKPHLDLDDTNLLANQSTTLPNTTQMNGSHFNHSSSVPLLLQKSLNLDRPHNFHKQLQHKLDKLIKKKDYQLLLQMTKAKLAKQMSVSKLFKRQPTRKKTDSSTYSPPDNKEPGGPFMNKLPLINMKNPDGEGLAMGQLSPIPNKTQHPSPALHSVPHSSNDSQNSDAQEIQAMMTEDTTRLKKQKTSYAPGTKSILCKRFVKLGQCLNGDHCEYAHSKRELQFNSPQEWVDLVKNISLQQLRSERSKQEGSINVKTLMEACKIDDHRGAEYLLKNGASSSAQDFNGNDALYYAVINNSFKALTKIFEYGFDQIESARVYGKKKRNILVIAAIYSHDIRILDLLLNNDVVKFNPNQTDRFSRNAIFYSLFRNKIEAVKLFINASTSLDIPDLKGMYLIDYSLQFNFEDILLHLVRGGAKLGHQQKKGVEIMMHAACLGNMDLIKALLAKNVPLSSLSADTGQNCLMIALQANRKDLLTKLSDYMINCEAFNQQDRDYGETLLMKAVQRGDTDIVKLISQKPGIKLGIKDNFGKTELIHAVEKDSLDSVKYLLQASHQHKLDLEMNHYDKRQRTAIIYASLNQNHKILEVLLTHKFQESKELHVIKWRDELGKDVCDYASTDEVKMVLSKYIEKNNMLYQGYFDMMHSISKKLMQHHHHHQHDSTDISALQSKLATERGGAVKQRTILDISQLKVVAAQEKMKQRSAKNKLKKIEEDICEQAELMKKEMQLGEDEKILILQQISQKRLKKLSTIAIKFPKLTNLEQNPKFKQAIKQLYADANLSKYMNHGENQRTVNDILEHHSPKKVLMRHKMAKRGSQSIPAFDKDFELPTLIKPMECENREINIKDTLTRIFSSDQLHQFRALTESLNKNLEVDNTNRNSPSNLPSPHKKLSEKKFHTLNLNEKLPKIVSQRSKTVKRRFFKVQTDDSDIENEINDEIEELMDLVHSRNIKKSIRNKIQENFSC